MLSLKVLFLWNLFVLTVSIKPNIILIVTDDLDLVLNSPKALPKTKNLLVNKGTTLENSFVSTPVCCPSRSSILSGLYSHHHQVINNSLAGGCSSRTWQENVEPYNFNVPLNQNGYVTFYGGKYLNQYGYDKSGGTKHVPSGWDWWIGLVGNSKYYNFTLSINGTSHYFSNSYFTDILKDYSISFLNQHQVKSKPFFMFIAPSAPHAPFTPAPRHKNLYPNEKINASPSFNYCKNNLTDKHWLIRMMPCPLPVDSIPKLNDVYRNRLRTLAAVDELVEEIVINLNKIKILNETYIIFTSDNGYHIGQFSQAWDKRQPYETDIRVPLFIRGPNLLQNITVKYPVVNIDLAPTILDMAKISTERKFDGISFLNLMKENPQTYDRKFLIEYSGEGDTNTVSKKCSVMENDNLAECSEDFWCKCQDSRNNSYSCVRHLTQYKNVKYCKFFDLENFEEIYDLRMDPYELKNLALLESEFNLQSRYDTFFYDVFK